MILSIYLSLLPFDFQVGELREAFSRFGDVLMHPPGLASRADFSANGFFFAIAAFLLSGALSLDCGRRLRAASALVSIGCMACLSAALEFTQLFFRGRVASGMDVLADAGGGVVGALLWIFMGQSLVDWIRARAADRQREELPTIFLVMYAIWFVTVSLIPLDVTLDAGELVRKYRSGRIVLVPFETPGGVVSTRLLEDLRDVVLAVPIGMLSGLEWVRQRSRDGLLAALAAGTAFVMAIEVAQVFVLSRWADATDVVWGAIGVAGGAVLAFKWHQRIGARRLDAPNTRTPSQSAPTVGLAVWTVVVMAYHWYPFQFVFSASWFHQRLHGLSWIPMLGYYRSVPSVALDEFFTKLALAVPLGVMSRRQVRAADIENEWRRPLIALCVSLAFFGAIETGQVFLPSHVPDVGDVLVGVSGVFLGLVLSGRFASSA